MKKPELPRGLRWRGDSLMACFALRDVRCNGSHVENCDCGKIERRALGEVSVSYATEQLNIYKRQVREGRYQKRQARPDGKPLTVSDLWETYLKSYKLESKKAAWRQEMAWAHLKPAFSALRPDQLTTANVIAYQETRLAEGAAPATVNRESAALSAALFHAAQTTGEGGKPVIAHVPNFPKRLKESAPRKGFVTDEQYRVLAVNAKPLWLRCLIAVAYSFGFRKGELLNLRVRQVDFFERWLLLEQGTTKNDEGRKVRMTTEVYELMCAATAGKNPDDFVFTRTDGSPVRDPREEWYQLCVASGLGQWIPAKRKNGKDFLAYRGLNCHDFRRSAIRNLTRGGVSQSVAMKISGHKTVEVFRRYDDIINEPDLIDATRKIELRRQVSEESQTDTKTDTSAQNPRSDSSELPRM